MKIKASDKYILLTEIATAILNQGSALVATYERAVSIPNLDADQPNPLDGIFEKLRDALRDVTESLSKGLYRANCTSVLTEDIEQVYTTLQTVQSQIREYETEEWFSKYLVNLVCSVGSYIPILDKGLQNLRCQA
ncbi:MAG: hypothetical protein NXI10_05445 [bacterium]|nr:hypothetical protein [bacterium]